MREFIDSFVLHDQYGREHLVTFDGPMPTILLISDRRGTMAAQAWSERLATLKGRASRPAAQRVIPIVALPGGPRWLRPMRRRSFRRQPPILLDWGNVLAELFDFAGGCLAVRIEPGGMTSEHAVGPPTDEAVERLTLRAVNREP